MWLGCSTIVRWVDIKKRAPGRRPSYAKHNNYTLNVGTYLGASASGGASHRGPVSNDTRVIGVFNGQPPMPDSHPEITSIRSLVEAHSSVTPGQGAERPQPGDSSEQGKSASERLTSISDAHSQRTLPSRTVPRIHCSGRALCRPRKQEQANNM